MAQETSFLISEFTRSPGNRFRVSGWLDGKRVRKTFLNTPLPLAGLGYYSDGDKGLSADVPREGMPGGTRFDASSWAAEWSTYWWFTYERFSHSARTHRVRSVDSPACLIRPRRAGGGATRVAEYAREAPLPLERGAERHLRQMHAQRFYAQKVFVSGRAGRSSSVNARKVVYSRPRSRPISSINCRMIRTPARLMPRSPCRYVICCRVSIAAASKK